MWYWLFFYRRRWGLVLAALAGACIALGRMDPWTRERVLTGLLAWLAVNWTVALPWGLSGVLALLWRRQLRLTGLWREATDYWRDLYDNETHPATAAKRAVQAQRRNPSKVGAGRRI